MNISSKVTAQIGSGVAATLVLWLYSLAGSKFDLPDMPPEVAGAIVVLVAFVAAWFKRERNPPT